MHEKKKAHFNRLKKLAYWLDAKFEGPFGIRFGLDPIIGLVPILGDIVTLLFSLYILLNSYLLGCSFTVFLRMLFNIGLEYILQLIPIIGKVFDFIWQSNTKNIELLEAHLNQPELTHKKSKWVLIGVVGLLFLFMLGCLALTIWLFRALILFIWN